ncbi:MAG: YggS family pyridoxal phosphate-dependent enzyme [Gammaproteobacteria bacterium]
MKIRTINEFQQELDNLITQYGVAGNRVQLLAVSKTRSVDEICQLVAQGQRCFGENYLQEAIEKIERLKHRDLEWHFIGKIQSNKTKLIATSFDWVHTVDRLKIAQRLSEQRPENLPPLKICLQVNSSGEISKGGVDFEVLPELAKTVSQLPGLELRGLMTLPAPTVGFDQQRQPFHQLCLSLEALAQQGLNLDTLSMGTTNDYRAAIAEGLSIRTTESGTPKTTIIRVGTALFGPRE